MTNKDKNQIPDEEKKEGLFPHFEVMSEVMNADEILNRKVSKLGNSGHISIPSKHIGKDAKIIIKKVTEIKNYDKHYDPTTGGALTQKPIGNVNLNEEETEGDKIMRISKHQSEVRNKQGGGKA